MKDRSTKTVGCSEDCASYLGLILDGDSFYWVVLAFIYINKQTVKPDISCELTSIPI